MLRNRYAILGVVSTVIIALDQATKIFIDRTMDLHQSIVVIQNFFDITYVRNKGAAFGMLARSPWRLPFFLIISAVAVVAIIAFIRKLRPDQTLTAYALSLILAGAVGNFIDRVRLGEVIDFIYVHWYQHYWPAFNVADSAICIGVGLLALEMLMEEQASPRQ